MSARIINLAYYNALKAVEAQIRDVKIANDRLNARLKAEADRRRERIEAYLQSIEADVAADTRQRPCDSESAA